MIARCHRCNGIGRTLQNGRIDSTDRFHSMIGELSSSMLKAAATGFHHFFDQPALAGRLLRHYTQNVDYIECTLPSS
jgi:NAD-dependent SIR2 family protein deacetylase